MMFLIDIMHDLDSFRQFLNRRLEDKSTLFKQKNDLHAEIKKIEQEKQAFEKENKQKNKNVVLNLEASQCILLSV